MGFDKQAIIAKQRLHDSDTGSAKVQISLLTERSSKQFGPVRMTVTGGSPP